VLHDQFPGHNSSRPAVGMTLAQKDIQAAKAAAAEKKSRKK